MRLLELLQSSATSEVEKRIDVLRAISRVFAMNEATKTSFRAAGGFGCVMSMLIWPPIPFRKLH